VVIADTRLNPLDPMSGHKTLNYWGRLRELQSAAAKRAGEALVFQVTNHVAGGCVSNIFLVRGGELLTPIARGEEGGGGEGSGAALPSPVLPGITRKWVMEWAGDRGMAVTRRMLSIDDVLGADEAFLTNSSWGVLPVVRVEKEMLGGGEVGEVARAAREAWLTAD
jgi:branched-subunit amino acid aminotransferase/4-amino-4-deoxychorismate lyase